MVKLTGMEWLKKHMKKLEVTNSEHSRQIDTIKNIEPEIFNEFQKWTPLKLILLNYALETCTTIIKKKSFFRKLYYVDLFSGSGINKLKKTNDFLIGSPLISSLNYSEDYNQMFFVESEPSFNAALDKRLNSLEKKNLKIFPQDYKDCLDEIIKIVDKPNAYTFFFIDPYSNEFEWDFMKKILNIKRDGIKGRDILLTFMSKENMRAVGLAKKGGSKGEKLTNLFGDDSWKKVNNNEELVRLYEKKILEEVPETIIRTIKIQSKKYNFCYHVLFIVNKTQGGNPWIKSIEKAKKEIESNSDKSVDLALDIIKKRQKELGDF